MTDWFRSWHGAPTDNKWLVIARKAGVAPGIVSAVVWALLDHASQSDSRGFVDDFDVETYSIFSGFNEADVMSVVAALEDKGVIVEGRMSAWEKRQPKREDNSTGRVTRHRETQRNAAKRDETQCNAPEERRVDTDSSEANASGRASVEPSPSPSLASPKDRIWNSAPRLAKLANRSEQTIRGFLGKCLAEFDADIVERAVVAAIDEGSGDPAGYITRCLKPATNGSARSRAGPDPNSWEAFDPEALKAEYRQKQAETIQ